MLEKLEILRISFLDVDIGRCGSVSCWIVSIQSSRWHQRRLRQFDFGLTCKNEILSVWLGREPSFFMHLLHCAISVVRDLPHLENQLFFSKGNSRHSKNIPVHNCLVEVYVWAAATPFFFSKGKSHMKHSSSYVVLVALKTPKQAENPYRSNLYLKNHRLAVCQHKIPQVLQPRSSGEFKTQKRIGFSVSPHLQCSCNYLLTWSIWPVGSFGIYRPESTRRKLLSCAMYSLQIPKSGLALHHP